MYFHCLDAAEIAFIGWYLFAVSIICIGPYLLLLRGACKVRTSNYYRYSKHLKSLFSTGMIIIWIYFNVLQNDPSLLNVWIVIQIIGLVYSILRILIAQYWLGLLGVPLGIYCIYVVYKFKEELQNGGVGSVSRV